MSTKKSSNFENPVFSAMLAVLFTAIPIVGFIALLFKCSVFFFGNNLAKKWKGSLPEFDTATKHQLAYQLFMKSMMATVYHIFWAGCAALVAWFGFNQLDGWVFNAAWSAAYAISYLIIAPTLDFVVCKKIRNS